MNGFRTAALMAVLIVLFALAGQAIGGQQGLFIAFGFAVLLNFGSYWFSDKIVLRMYGAHEVDRTTAPELVDMVDRLRQRAGLPMPKVYVIPSEQPNAFATGRSPSHAAVAVTNGIVRLLSREELEGVIAHELAHIQNRDILTSSIAATLASAITLLARFAFFFGGSDRDRGGAVAGLLMLILAPIAAMLIQMAISRTREFAADRDGARICGRPRALANALARLQRGAEAVPMEANPGTAHMFIVNPFSGMMSGIQKLFSTHPPTEERIERLLELERTGL
ncbi:MAG: zinc metalloprotease HtpX [Bacteroidetes bacterium]|nr:protease HtpX [Rhodothermaceae bacterium RA]RMH51109.1 MAG: zinc metalloprotease HtpX [Bacteroidota bacterium]